MSEKVISGRKNGMPVLILTIFLYVVAGVLFIKSIQNASAEGPQMPTFVISLIIFCFGWILFLGLKVLKPQEALVLTLFGKYIGTLKGDGFYFVNPFVYQNLFVIVQPVLYELILIPPNQLYSLLKIF